MHNRNTDANKLNTPGRSSHCFSCFSRLCTIAVTICFLCISKNSEAEYRFNFTKILANFCSLHYFFFFFCIVHRSFSVGMLLSFCYNSISICHFILRIPYLFDQRSKNMGTHEWQKNGKDEWARSISFGEGGKRVTIVYRQLWYGWKQFRKFTSLMKQNNKSKFTDTTHKPKSMASDKVERDGIITQPIILPLYTYSQSLLEMSQQQSKLCGVRSISTNAYHAITYFIVYITYMHSMHCTHRHAQN